MAGFGAATYTGSVGRDDIDRGVRLRRRRATPRSRRPGSRARARSSASTSTRGSSNGRSDFGATHTVDASKDDAVEAIRALTDGNGADVCIEAVGRPEVLKQAFYARDLAGTVVQVGVPTPDMALPDIPMIDFFGRGGALKPSWYGDCLPSRDFPTLIDLYLQGRFPLDKFVSETIALDEVEARVPQDGARRGAALRRRALSASRVAVSRGSIGVVVEREQVRASCGRRGAPRRTALPWPRGPGPRRARRRAARAATTVTPSASPTIQSPRATSTSPTIDCAADAARAPAWSRRAARSSWRTPGSRAPRARRRRGRRRRSRGRAIPRASAPVVSTSPQ